MRFFAMTIIAALLSIPVPAQQRSTGEAATFVLRANGLKPSGDLRLDGLF